MYQHKFIMTLDKAKKSKKYCKISKQLNEEFWISRAEYMTRESEIDGNNYVYTADEEEQIFSYEKELCLFEWTNDANEKEIVLLCCAEQEWDISKQKIFYN